MRADSTLFYIATILISIGIVFSLSLTTFTVLFYDYNHLHFFIRQFIVGSFGVFLMWALSRANPDRFLTPFCIFMFLFTFALMLVMPFMPSNLVREVNGAARWINLPGISLAPVEFFKIGFIYFLAWSFTRKIDGTKKSFKTEIIILLPYMVVFFIVILTIGVLQNDLGQVFVLSMVLLVMVILAGTSFRIIMSGFVLVASIVFVAIGTSEHRVRRVMSWWGGMQEMILSFFPDDVAEKLYVEGTETPYQVSHSLNAINNGSLFGEGLGLGTFKLGFLSEVHTDFVLAGIAEEAGFIGLLIITALFFILLYRVFRVGLKSKNNVHYLFCVGIGFMFLFSFMVNSYGITSLIPIKGIAVPFLSYGGSQLLGSSMAIGFILMISKKIKA
ncbi:MAG: FtsW/RodA/SpoVE family cell cycle protein [Campylobacteraceae bacterium]|nr:FtsW/RodA/SpoVE family cell cycle protein [Campylobacteraceae bacterium]